MNNFKRIAGILTIILAAASIIFSVYLLLMSWQIRMPLEENLSSVITLFSDTLNTTEDGLILMSDTLTNASENINNLQDAMLAMAQTLNDTGSTIDNLIIVVDNDLPLTISSTQISLNSAGTTAAVIDEIMTALSKIPLINISYDPDTPLSVALDEVSTSLENIPSSMESLSEDLSQTQDSLEIFEGDIIELTEGLDSIEENISQTQDVVEDYLRQIDQFQKYTESGIESLSKWLTAFSLSITFIILWLLISQIGLLLQGISWMQTEQTNRSVEQ